MKSKLPLYKISIDPEYSENGEDLGIQMIAFTSNPAIVVKGMAFAATTPKKKQYFGDKIKNRIVAPVMIPMEIYRCDDEEYYVEFTEQEIEKIHLKFMKNFTNRQIFNFEHNADDIAPAIVLECWIVDNPTEDKAFSSYGIKVPKGTVMMTAQITDKETYTRLVENEQTGFSIEGFLGLSLSEIINKNKEKQEKMSKHKFEAIKTANGGDVWIEGEMAIDSYVYCKQPSIMLIDGKRSETRYPIWDSVVELEDGTILTLEDGKILKVEAKEAGAVAPEVADTALAEEVKEENKEEDKIKEEKMSEDVKKEDEVKTEEVKAAEEVKTEVKEEEKVELAEGEVAPAAEGEFYSKAEIDKMFDDMYKMIAEIKAEKGDDVIEDKVEEEVKLSAHERFAAFARFSATQS